MANNDDGPKEVQPLDESTRRKWLPYVSYVGAGYYSSNEAFKAGEIGVRGQVIQDFFNSAALPVQLKQLQQFDNAVLIFFGMAGTNRVQITREDAIWFLDNRPN